MLRVALVIDDYNELIYLQTLLKKLGFDVEGLQNQRKYADVSLGFNPNILITTAKGKKVNGLALAQSINKRRGIPKILALQTAGGLISAEEQQAAGVDMVLDSPVNVKKLILAVASLAALDEAMLLDKYNKIITTMNSEADANLVLSDEAYELDENGQPIIPVTKIKNEIESIVVKGDKKSESAPKHRDGSLESLQGQKSQPAAVGGQGAQATDPDIAAAVPSRSGPVPVSIGAASDSLSTEQNGGVGESFAMPTAEEKSQRDQRYENWLKNMEPLIAKNFDRERILAFNKIIRSAIRMEDIEEVEDERKKFVKALFKK